ncbi:hypothetical protein [Nocardiopsis changdeensis]|uniref:hypothetical protein n=1 Tax=Nocardiopsis changdeensis TaxID=2831969 RepID=UPI003F4716EE
MSDLIDPSGFPVPETLTYSLDAVAAKLKTDGTDLTDTAADITGAWAGLEGIYSAPEDQDLFTVLNPLTGDGDEVSTALSSASDALSDFAETVRGIKERWATLKSDSYAFLNKIEGDEDWRDGGGFLWWKTESPEVAEHNALLDRAAGLLYEFEEAERTCANAITGLFGGTTFIAQKADGSVTAGEGQFVYGFDAPLEGVPMEWGAPQTTDHAWYNDFGDAVGDFFVGIAEDVGGMVGAHGPNGWFSGNWGDNLWDYWGGTVEGLGALVGVGKDENGNWGWSLETAGNAWKEAAHAVVPWEEWGDRPWYTIGTALLNVGAVVGGALLTATGVGAVVGVPLMAWRGAKIVNAVGGSRTPDVPDFSDLPGGIDPSLLSRIPRFGDGSFKPLDLSDVEGLDISAADLGRMNEALERLNNSTADLPDGTDNRRTTDTGSEPGGETGSTPRGTTTNGSDTETENTDRRDSGSDPDETVDPTADQLDAGQEFLDGIDPESRRELEEGLNNEQDRWVASQEVPDDASSITDPDRVEVDGAGDGINARNDVTVDNSVGGGTGLDTPRGGTAVVDLDSGSGRGGSTGGGFDGTDGNGNGLPDGPDDLTPDGDATPDRTDTEHTPREYVQRAGGSESADNPRSNLEEGPGFYDADGDHIDVGHRDETGTYFDAEGNRYVDVPQSARALEQYNEIRDNDGDVDRISENTGYDSNVLEEIKQHLFFREHPDVPVPPDGTTLRSGRFAPMDHIADLWRKAEAGTLDPSEANAFRRLVMHEYVEARLMDEGVPYRSRDPELWHDDYYEPTPDRNGAHDVAPLEGRDNNFALWDKWGIPKPDADFEVADDMSNLDRVAENALEWWRDRNLPQTPEALETHRWGTSPQGHRQFLEHFNRLVNDPNSGVLEEFYRPKDGHRISQYTTVGPEKFPLPKLTRLDENSPWVVQDTLPTPDPPDYLGGVNKAPVIKYDVESNPSHALDSLAESRDRAITRDTEAARELKRLEDKYKNQNTEGANAPEELQRAREEYTEAHREMIRITEDFGERSAEVAVREQFNGSSPDRPMLSENGPVEMPDTVPRNGNHQFDQIWRTQDGGIVVVEAKSSQGTTLGSRLVPDGNGGVKRVSQGTEEYFQSILEAMERRGTADEMELSPDSDKFTELALAQEIRKAMREGKLHYVEVKGNPVVDSSGNQRFGGYSFAEFDVFRETD